MNLIPAEQWNHALNEAELEDRSFEPVIRQIQANALRYAVTQLHKGSGIFHYGMIVMELKEEANQLDPQPPTP